MKGGRGRATSWSKPEEVQIKTRKPFLFSMMVSLFLFTSCAGEVDMGPTSTPDPMLMSIEERTIWDFDNLRNQINDLAATAAETPPEDLEPILHQLVKLIDEIREYEYPINAAQAHSTLFNFANSTTHCYMYEYDVHVRQMSDENLDVFYGDTDFCEQAKDFEETFDLYLQEMKELDS
ncbi:MAG TPA: hypothetical protein ENG59_02640 [Chloroflexi bacterium]|nr:MAG: hypothetical protein DRI46_01595 [Chloroflexota bacterium]HDD55125.1 hypothetical protein [Chloroflexota bacterium]